MKIYKTIYYIVDTEKKHEEYFLDYNKAKAFLENKVNFPFDWEVWVDGSIYANLEKKNGDEIHLSLKEINVK